MPRNTYSGALTNGNEVYVSRDGDRICITVRSGSKETLYDELTVEEARHVAQGILGLLL